MKGNRTDYEELKILANFSRRVQLIRKQLDDLYWETDQFVQIVGQQIAEREKAEKEKSEKSRAQKTAAEAKAKAESAKGTVTKTN